MYSVFKPYSIHKVRMSVCKICGETGHSASRCSELVPSPDGMYTGPGSEGGGEEEDSISVLMKTMGAIEMMQHVQDGSRGGEILPRLQVLV